MSRAARPPATATATATATGEPTVQQVAVLQRHMPHWLVMWSRWRRRWVAFAQFGPVPLIVEEETAGRLLERCGAEETAAASGRRVVMTA